MRSFKINCDTETYLSDLLYDAKFALEDYQPVVTTTYDDDNEIIVSTISFSVPARMQYPQFEAVAEKIGNYIGAASDWVGAEPHEFTVNQVLADGTITYAITVVLRNE